MDQWNKKLRAVRTIDRRHPGHHKHARGHHGGGMNQRGDRSRPSIESGSHARSGTWADLPMAPINNRMPITEISDQLVSPKI